MANNPSYNKKKGAEFESAIVKFLRKLGHTADRIRLGGQGFDQGDKIGRASCRERV